MTTAYFECSSGVSGDMILGALVDAGLSISTLSTALRCLPIKGVTLKARHVKRSTIAATKIDVIIPDASNAPRTLHDMSHMIKSADLPPSVMTQSLHILTRMTKAEAHAHGTTPAKVIFHEIGAIDTIVDVVGGLLGCSLLGIDRVTASSINLGSGAVTTSHGTIPIPVPATAELLKGVPVYTSSIQAELTTPTGAAILTSLAADFGLMPEMNVQSIGYGAGTQQIPNQPNLLRVFVGNDRQVDDIPVSMSHTLRETAVMIESNIDDMNPQIYDMLIDRLLSGGALDVTLTPVIMKQGRPGITLGVLSPQDRIDTVIRIIFHETTTLGIRFHSVTRTILSRTPTTVDTPYGLIEVKVATLDDGTQRRSPEYRHCKRIAQQTGTPVREIMEVVRRAIDRA